MSDLNLMIGFSSSHGWLSGMIRWFLKSRISHTFLSIDTFGARLTIGADEGGLNWCEVSRFKKTNQVMLVLRPRQNIDTVFDWFVQKHAGAEYDWISAGIGGIRTRIKWMWYWFKHWLRKGVKKESLNCAEVTGLLLERAGYPFAVGLDTEITTAQELMFMCLRKENRDHFEIIWIDPKLKADYPDLKL